MFLVDPQIDKKSDGDTPKYSPMVQASPDATLSGEDTTAINANNELVEVKEDITTGAEGNLNSNTVKTYTNSKKREQTSHTAITKKKEKKITENIGQEEVMREMLNDFDDMDDFFYLDEDDLDFFDEPLYWTSLRQPVLFKDLVPNRYSYL